jgi:hypothetical protein
MNEHKHEAAMATYSLLLSRGTGGGILGLLGDAGGSLRFALLAARVSFGLLGFLSLFTSKPAAIIENREKMNEKPKKTKWNTSTNLVSGNLS